MRITICLVLILGLLVIGQGCMMTILTDNNVPGAVPVGLTADMAIGYCAGYDKDRKPRRNLVRGCWIGLALVLLDLWAKGPHLAPGPWMYNPETSPDLFRASVLDFHKTGTCTFNSGDTIPNLYPLPKGER